MLAGSRALKISQTRWRDLTFPRAIASQQHSTSESPLPLLLSLNRLYIVTYIVLFFPVNIVGSKCFVLSSSLRPSSLSLPPPSRLRMDVALVSWKVAQALLHRRKLRKEVDRTLRRRWMPVVVHWTRKPVAFQSLPSLPALPVVWTPSPRVLRFNPSLALVLRPLRKENVAFWIPSLVPSLRPRFPRA